MAEMIFKKCCPCGNSVAENKAHPPYYFWPYTSAVGGNGVFSYSTSMPDSGAIKAKGKSPGE